MSSPDVTLTGAVDDARGLGVSVYQDHAGVRIDASGIEISFDLGGLQAFMHLLADAACESRLWEISQAAPDETAYIDYPGLHHEDCDCEACITFYAERNKS